MRAISTSGFNRTSVKRFWLGAIMGGALVGAGIWIGTNITQRPIVQSAAKPLPAPPKLVMLPSQPKATPTPNLQPSTTQSDHREAILRRFGRVASVEAGWGGQLPPNPAAQQAETSARTLASQGREREAIQLLRDAITKEKHPAYAEILRFRLLDLHEQAGDRATAIALLEEIGRESMRMDTQAAVLERLQKMGVVKSP